MRKAFTAVLERTASNREPRSYSTRSHVAGANKVHLHPGIQLDVCGAIRLLTVGVDVLGDRPTLGEGSL
jgi:hypothetical protein